MEAAASVAVAARGVSMTMPSSQSSRKEWRVVSDHLVQNSGKESVNGSDDELHLEDVVKQREQLQHLEVNLKARLIARSEVLGMQERFDSQINEHINSNVKLQEQLHEMENSMMELQRTLDDKDKELHAIRLDHEAAWAKEDLLREQNKELATFRRELDNSEADRAQNLQKIHDLQEHIQEKERQFIELQEQHRVAQETLRYKDEQLGEAQAWISRVQEMDVMQSTSLNAELRERIEQYNQLWVGCQRQYAEMERLHMQTLQQLESELSEARERNGTNSDGSHTAQSQTQVKDVSRFVHGNGSQLEANGASNAASDSRVLQNGDAEIVSSQTDNIPAAQVTAQSLHGMPNYFPPGHLAAMHPYFLHYQGLPQSVNSHIVQSHAGQFHSLPANSPVPHWQNQQAFSESSQMQNHESYSSQNDQHSSRPETNYNFEVPINGEALRSNFLDISQGLESHSVISSSPNEGDQQSLQQISSQFHTSLKLNHSSNDINHQEQNANMLMNHVVEPHSLSTEQHGSSVVASDVTRSAMVSEVSPNNVEIAQQNNYIVKALFDEGTLLACVVRTIPPGPRGRIQISSTLLSRLTKMLAPLHWSDYENKYGKLNAFLGNYPELFIIEGDYIQVREGAQEIIAGMVARAKVRAATVAASAASSHSSLLSSVAVTPMAQTRLKKAPSINYNYANTEKNRFIESQHQNGGVSFNPVGVKVMSKPSDQMNVPSGNGLNVDRSNVGSQGKVISHGRSGSNYHGKAQGRSTGGLLGSRK